MTELISPITNRPLYPTASPLRPFPEKLLEKMATRGMRRLLLTESGPISFDLALRRFQHLEIHIKSGVNIDLTLISLLPDDYYTLSFIKIYLDRDAQVRTALAMKGGARSEIHIGYYLQGSGAEAAISGIFRAAKSQQQACHVVMQHEARSTKGDILLKGVYSEKSKGFFTGLIKILPAAQQTNSYFADNVLLMDEAMADSIPSLEIEANDVRASHGSTTGRVDAQQLFYLTARGLPAKTAKTLIAEGFLQPVRRRWPVSAAALIPQSL